MALRNELRDPGNNSPATGTYDWQHWYPNMIAGANAINAANGNVLIFYSGLGFDTDMSAITSGQNLGNGQTFSKSSFSYANKIVFELHNYNNGLGDSNCNDFNLYNQGSRRHCPFRSRNLLILNSQATMLWTPAPLLLQRTLHQFFLPSLASLRTALHTSKSLLVVRGLMGELPCLQNAQI